MLTAVNHDGLLLAQRGADGVRALAVFGPVDTGRQCHLRSLFQKVVVAQRMQHHAFGRGQEHHAVGIGDLPVQRFHGRRGMQHQKTIFLHRLRQGDLRRRRKIRRVGTGNAEGLRTLVRRFNQRALFFVFGFVTG